MLKYSILSSALLSMLITTACTNGSTKDNNSGEDTTASVATATDSTPADNKATDYTFFELKGNVKSCTLVSAGFEETYTFTPEGKYATYSREIQNIIGCERDTQGRIVSLHIKDAIDREYAENYEYDEKGRISKSSCEADPDGLSFELTNTYDSNDRLISSKGWWDGPGPLEYSYKYLTEDEQGNWTKRIKSTTLEGEEPYDETEERTIEYY